MIPEEAPSLTTQTGPAAVVPVWVTMSPDLTDAEFRIYVATRSCVGRTDWPELAAAIAGAPVEAVHAAVERFRELGLMTGRRFLDMPPSGAPP
jgi:hypothetical protein